MSQLQHQAYKDVTAMSSPPPPQVGEAIIRSSATDERLKVARTIQAETSTTELGILSEEDLSALAGSSASGFEICSLERQYRRCKGTSAAMSREQWQMSWRFPPKPPNLSLQRMFDCIVLKDGTRQSTATDVMSCCAFIETMLILQQQPIADSAIRFIWEMYIKEPARPPTPTLLHRERMASIALALLEVARAGWHDETVIELGYQTQGSSCLVSRSAGGVGAQVQSDATTVRSAVDAAFTAADLGQSQSMRWTHFEQLCSANLAKLSKSEKATAALSPIALFFLPFNLTVLKDGRVIFFCG